MIEIFWLGGVVQLVERQSPKLIVMGSSPATSAIFIKRFFNQKFLLLRVKKIKRGSR